MFKRMAGLTLSIMMCASMAFADRYTEIIEMCTERWRTHDEMRNECIDTQEKAAEFWYDNYVTKYVAAFVAADDKDPTTTYMFDEAKMVFECSKKFEDAKGRYDYQRALKCCEARLREFNAAKQ